MRLTALLFSLALASGWSARGQSPPPPPPKDAGAPSSSLDWDRDFDLILESRQGTARENPKVAARTEEIQKELDTLRKEEADLEARLKLFSGKVADEQTLMEMVRMEVNSRERARVILEEKLSDARARIQDLEDELKRSRRGMK
jgi:chromosome segregation ATPase